MQANTPHRTERGQSLIELAFGMVILLILLVGMVNVGHAAITLLALNDAAQEAVMYASIMPLDCDGIAERAVAYGTDIAPYAIQVQINGKACASARSYDACAGRQAVVRLTYDEYPIFTPFVGALAGRQSWPLTATARAEIVNPTCP